MAMTELHKNIFWQTPDFFASLSLNLRVVNIFLADLLSLRQ